MSEQPDSTPNERSRPSSKAETTRTFPLPALIAVAVLLAVALLLLGRFCSSAAVINITVNDNPLALHGAKTVGSAIRESGLPINPGDYISLRGTVLKRNAGDPFYATVNGEETADPDQELHEGDVVVVTDGKDVVEEYDVVTETLPYDAVVTGVGAICTFEPGQPGIIEHRTGRISGDEVRRVMQDSENATATWHRPDVGNDMAIALTFDGGPSEHTSQILDVLKENDAQATFFCEGSKVGSNIEVVQREWNTYNQVASNTYDRNVSERSTADEVYEEVRLGFHAIAEALEGHEVKRVVRFPKALLTRDMAAVVTEEVDAVIGWDLDTGDWAGASADDIYETLLNVRSGEIVVMHDADDDDNDCSNTIEALRRALPKLKSRGFTFVTIDKLMGYPAKPPE